MQTQQQSYTDNQTLRSPKGVKAQVRNDKQDANLHAADVRRQFLLELLMSRDTSDSEKLVVLRQLAGFTAWIGPGSVMVARGVRQLTRDRAMQAGTACLPPVTEYSDFPKPMTTAQKLSELTKDHYFEVIDIIPVLCHYEYKYGGPRYGICVSPFPCLDFQSYSNAGKMFIQANQGKVWTMISCFNSALTAVLHPVDQSLAIEQLRERNDRLK